MADWTPDEERFIRANQNKLTACPFCGWSEAVFQKHAGDQFDVDREWWLVFCLHCCSSTGRFLSGDLALEAWNRRTPAPAGNSCGDE